ncbi:hypothetical protein SERLA73DRAFT_175361 [Serpula lacrymans var. lacrymans S7.3]|uniref:Uncharacterized protein n=2 Tax=Serpula lacrymans var. lacrymans TaxID=341189 RepID=F8PJB6_SERL3|nr:uncharacterized protein SERLADRAFT_457585 [Serpula lacrymans var. lacrymans S7.9]EGO03741.1 hypothetical protein SERLA73DRAFT_175361 [Serpula lacrymans var. lacrymans S7.3]EGO29608.1 hypothetical protein SERLADRAFT_457585 [Serpula lacrymans var. lacrymans S7.9]
MSFERAALYPCNPATTRGSSTKLSASKDKVVYTNGKAVIIRDLNDSALSVVYSGHVQNTTVARISPSGYYCASADITGTVKIWDTVGEDQTLKGEYKVISGRVNDLEWDGESKRIIAVGDGKERFGHAFLMDTGTTSGEISGHSKAINAVSIRHQRPFRAATAADDSLIVFHQGAPYKYDKTIKTHTKYVQDVRYAPSGDHFASVGSDFKIFLYDGKTGDTVAEITGDGHKGSIMACSWSPDSKSILTSSADRTVKLWDVETRKAITTWNLGTEIGHQQMGNTWSGAENLVSLSMSGDLNIFDRRVGDKPSRILEGPQKAITAAATVSASTFLAGTADGRIISYEAASGDTKLISGQTHTSLVSGMVAEGGKVFTTGFDDCVREIEGGKFTPASSATLAQPKTLAIAHDRTIFVAETNTVEAVRDNQRIFDLKPAYVPSSVAAGGSIVAVGGEDHKVHVYDWDGKALKEAAVLDGNKGTIHAVAVSADGSLLAAGDSSGKIVLYDVKDRTPITSRWSFHTARITSLAFLPSPSGTQPTHLASSSLDTNVYVWSVAKPMKYTTIRGAGPGGVNVVTWLGEAQGGKGKLVSAGADCCVRIWEVTLQ